MKTGRTLAALAAEIERRQATKQDFVVATESLGFDHHGEGDTARWALEVPGQGYFGISDHTHRQIATHLKVPLKYYDRMMAQAPDLLRANVRHWLDDSDARRMVRTLDGGARAYLSDRYRRVDNYEVLHAALPALADITNAVPLSAEVTDRKLYLKVLFPDISAEVRPGDTVRAGVLLENSEIGAGRLRVRGFTYRDFCYNGCVWGGFGDVFEFSRTHLGGRVIEGVDYQILSDETRQAEDRAILGEVRDTMKAAADPILFNRAVDMFRDAAESPEIPREAAPAAVEVLGNELGLTESERSAALINLIEDRDLTKWGALNAVTKIANTTESYDRASELEELGDAILNFSARQWSQVINAVPVAA